MPSHDKPVKEQKLLAAVIQDPTDLRCPDPPRSGWIGPDSGLVMRVEGLGYVLIRTRAGRASSTDDACLAIVTNFEATHD